MDKENLLGEYIPAQSIEEIAARLGEAWGQGETVFFQLGAASVANCEFFKAALGRCLASAARTLETQSARTAAIAVKVRELMSKHALSDDSSTPSVQ